MVSSMQYKRQRDRQRNEIGCSIQTNLTIADTADTPNLLKWRLPVWLQRQLPERHQRVRQQQPELRDPCRRLRHLLPHQ